MYSESCNLLTETEVHFLTMTSYIYRTQHSKHRHTDINSNALFDLFACYMSRYQQLVSEKASWKIKEEPWSLLEDFYLLKGYGIFGEKWHLHILFFLSHRRADDIKTRLAVLQFTLAVMS